MKESANPITKGSRKMEHYEEELLESRDFDFDFDDEGDDAYEL